MSWLWIHSPDRHWGVDVVCSNRSLGLETNDYSFPRSTSAKKRGKTTLTTAENSSEEVQKIDHAPSHLLVDRSTSTVDGSSSLSDIIRQLNASEIYVFCSSGMPTTRGARASCLETERKSTGVKEKASRDLGSALASSGEEKGPSIEMCMMRMRHDAMSGCAG